MKKNKLSIIFIILTIVCLFSLASIANGCGCSLIPVQESKDTEEAGERRKNSRRRRARRRNSRRKDSARR